METTLITGTSTGIGFATALLFARQGRKVYAGMRNSAKSPALEQIARREQLPLTVIDLDVTDQKSVENALEEIHRRSDNVEVLINNAGVGCSCPVEHLEEEMHRTVFETNYFGALRLIRAILPKMRELSSGTIINISSFAGLLAMPNQSAYSASKFALEAASEALAAEVKPFGIRVAIVEPGVTETAIFRNAEKTSHYDKTSPYIDLMKRNGKIFAYGRRQPESPETVAKLILHIADSDTHQLRHLIGKDAEKFVAGRKALSDEEWIGMFDKMEMEDYIDTLNSAFDLDLQK